MNILRPKHNRIVATTLAPMLGSSILIGCSQASQSENETVTPSKPLDTSYCHYDVLSSRQQLARRVFILGHVKLRDGKIAKSFSVELDSDGSEQENPGDTLSGENGVVEYQYPMNTSAGSVEHSFIVRVGQHACGPLEALVVDPSDTAHLEKIN